MVNLKKAFLASSSATSGITGYAIEGAKPSTQKRRFKLHTTVDGKRVWVIDTPESVEAPTSAAGKRLFSGALVGKIDLLARMVRSIDRGAHAAATSPVNVKPFPTEAQIVAGNYPKGHVTVGGIPVTIENPAGSTRRPEWPPMRAHYGYFKRTEGADGDHVDVFIKPGTLSDYDGPAFVVDQYINGVFDEHKVMLGWHTEAEACAGYKENFTDDWDGLGAITRMSLDELKAWLEGDTTAPVAPLTKGDKPGHPFRGNQWTRASVGADGWSAAGREHRELKIKYDNPGGSWEAGEQRHADAAGRNQWGAPERFGATTGYFNRQVMLPVSMLAQVKGEQGEQMRVRQEDLAWQVANGTRTGMFPIARSFNGKDYGEGGTYAPFIRVNHRGEAWVTEGNHRLMAAQKLGWKYVPVELKYHSGGEKNPGPFHPERVRMLDQAAVAEGHTPYRYGGKVGKVDLAQWLRKDYDESKHPRDEIGRWTSGEGAIRLVRNEEKKWVVVSEHVVDPAMQERIAALKLRPDLTNVRLNPNPKGSLQALGEDSKGRTQYIYSAEHTARQAVAKFERAKDFAAAVPTIRAQALKDMTTNDAAAVTYLIAQTGFRVGGSEDTGADKKAYGASTLLHDHVRVEGDTVHFNFDAKSGVAQSKSVTDAPLARMLSGKLASTRPGEALFSADEKRVSAYIKQTSGNAAFKTKDFRTWHGTSMALHVMESMPVPTTIKEYNKSRAAVGKAVAAHLGNTPTVALQSYVAPEVFTKWKLP